MLGLNTDHSGPEVGLGAIPGREAEARADIDRAIGYALAVDCPAIHVMAGCTGRAPGSEAAYRADLAHAAELDALIDDASEGWSTERMPAVDRVLLRMAVFELLHRPDVPTAAVLAEVVELAGDYSTERSGRFVNGVVSRLAEELRPTVDGA
jgi:hypothetical protein